MLTQNIAPKPAANPVALPAALPSQPANPTAGPSFAQFLTEQASPPAPPAQNASEAAEHDTAPEPAAAPPNATSARRPPAAKASTPARAPEGVAKVDPKAAAKADAKPTTDIKAEGEDRPETKELDEFTQLIGMSAPPPAPASLPDAAAAAAQAGHRAAGHGKASAPADEAAPPRSAGRSGEVDASASARAGDAKQAKVTERQADQRAAGKELLQAASAQAPNTEGPLPATPHAGPEAAAGSFAAALAQALPAAPVVSDSATTTARLQSPVPSSAFAPELGARVSLLAVDGVQQAELQLNPADMGPVSVQIVVDGGQAQVSFHAAHAETRQALEQSLPDLAAALQGQGLTLSGGGVFQQAPRDADQGGSADAGSGSDRSSRRGAERAGGPSRAAAAPARRSVGLLDTFA